MAKDHLCEYGNCTEMRIDVRVSYHGERKTFCCVDHAALWLLRQQYPKAGIALDWDRHVRAVTFAARLLEAQAQKESSDA